ncbi:MAG: inositol monophosphatase family protein [Terriglobales bacterium]
MDIIETAYETAIEACLQATEVIRPLWPNPSNHYFDYRTTLDRIEKEGIGNFATIADLQSERKIIETIQSKPLLAGHSILSEESAEIMGDDELRWIVDPIYGTQNFSNGIPDFGICIALFCGQKPIVGVIAMPALRQIVAVKHGDPARLISYDRAELADLRGLARRYSDSLENALVGYNLGYHDRAEQLEMIAQKLIANVGYASCLGSFSTGNFRLLQGMMGIYFGTSPTVMDIAPAAALIPSIGGVVTDLAGLPIDWKAPSRSYVGGINPRIHEQFLSTLNA